MKYGLRPDLLQQNGKSETPEKVGAAIKELFPKIPEQDLHDIVHHAWEEGTQRIGNNTTMDLPRRVQLATIARIRHMYTDYDRLLRAFEWKEARSMVEPECLKKLIEWRGETDDADDEGLEEIVRETIVIDDDEVVDASEADDEDSTSDASVEITHVALGDDLGAESGIDEKSRRLLRRAQPQHNIGYHNSIAKQKIGAVRQQLRAAAPAPAAAYPAQPAHHDHHERPAREVVMNGQRFLVRPAEDFSHIGQNGHPLTPRNGMQGQHSAPNQFASRIQSYLPSGGSRAYDQPVASIEKEDERSNANGYRPLTPENGVAGKRRRVELPRAMPGSGGEQYRPVYAERRVLSRTGRAVQAVPAGAEIVDLTSPGRPARSSPYVVHELAAAPQRPNERYMPIEHRVPGSALHSRPTAGHAQPEIRYQRLPVNPESYDPTQPTQVRMQYMQPQLVPAERQMYGVPQGAPQYGIPHGQPHHQLVYTQQQPVHGAPAPIQQLPRDISQVELPYGQVAGVHGEPQHRQYVFADGAVAPTQFYYPR